LAEHPSTSGNLQTCLDHPEMQEDSDVEEKEGEEVPTGRVPWERVG